MTRRCIIEGCTSKSSNPQHQGVTFHSFPFDSKTREIWIANSRINPEKNITKSVLVCSRHFRRVDFQPAKSNKYLLKQGAVPTIFPWGRFPPPNTTATAGEAPATPATETSNETSTSNEASITNEAVAPKPNPLVQLESEMEALAGSIAAGLEESPADKPMLKRALQDSPTVSDAKMPKLTVTSPTAAAADIQNLVPIGTIPAPAGGRKSETVSGFVPGVRLEAQDFDGVWHTARVVEVDNDEREVLIQFEKSGKSKGPSGVEEWIPMNSSRLRQKISTPTKSPNVFVLGEKCLARWSGARRFPATVHKVLENDMYEILFDDGYMKVLKSAHISKLKVPINKQSPAGASTSPVMAQKPTASSTPEKPKSKTETPRKDWPLISMSSLNLAELNLPEIPKDGEWCCHWVNDQPIGREGYLTVGDHKKPTVIVDDWRLPPGWTKHMYQRSNVLGKWDVILVNENAKRFRSKADLKLFIEDLGQHYNPDVYDFSIHRRRAKDIGAYAYTKDYKPPQPVKPPPQLLEPLPPLQPETFLQNTGQSSAVENILAASTAAAATPSPLFEPPPPVKSVEEAIPPLDDGYVYVGSLKVQIIDNLFRCPKEGCNKNFRKENHLQIHIKHYHEDIVKFLGDCPNMQELACKRTIGHPPDEPLPKNYLPNSQYFAKLHQQDILNRTHRKSTNTPLTANAASTSVDSFLMSTTADDSSKLMDVTMSDITAASTTLPASPSSFIHPTGDEMSSLADELMATPQLPSTSKSASRKSGDRKSSRQRLTKKYVTASTSNLFDTSSFQLPDSEETRHSFNRTPEHQQRAAKKAKLSHPTPVQDANMDGNTTTVSVPDQSQLPPNQSPKYIQENGEVIKIVRMRQEEIINCICQFGEEDGLMIQCELCLCWQHGICNGIEKECQVPDKYVCYICRNPLLGRESMQYIHDQDWLYEGKLPTGNYHGPNPKLQDRFNILRTSHTLTGNLVELKRFLHSLRVKINMAQNKDHPKMYLWAKKWESSPPRSTETKVEKCDDMEAAMKEETSAGEGPSDMITAGGVGSADNLELKEETDPKQEIKIQLPNIPQPEAAIDPVECQHRLLEHIQKQQSLAVERLQDIESDINELESLDPSGDMDPNEFSRTKKTLAMLIKDLETMQNLALINKAPVNRFAPVA